MQLNNPQSLEWKLARRTFTLGARTLVMGILNLTPDSFSDGRRFHTLDAALARAEEIQMEGADLLDIGGESSRPGAQLISPNEEKRRIIPLIEYLLKIAYPLPISLDTTKAEVARAGLEAGAEIVNDISALRFNPKIAIEAAHAQAGLILMHSRGATLDQMHKLEPVTDIFHELKESLQASITNAQNSGVNPHAIVLDPGLGFGKTHEQNLALLARLDELINHFPNFPWLVGTSRKSFIGKILGQSFPEHRLHGTMATITTAILCGAHIVRVHDVAAAVETVRIADAIKEQMRRD